MLDSKFQHRLLAKKESKVNSSIPKKRDPNSSLLVPRNVLLLLYLGMLFKTLSKSGLLGLLGVNRTLVKVDLKSKQRFLQFHPKLRSAKSELYFFNKHYEELGMQWYLEQFEEVAVRGLTLFEKTPTYYQNIFVPQRIFDAFPDMKLIISGLC